MHPSNVDLSGGTGHGISSHRQNSLLESVRIPPLQCDCQKPSLNKFEIPTLKGYIIYYIFTIVTEKSPPHPNV